MHEIQTLPCIHHITCTGLMTGYPRFFIPIIFSRRQNSIRHDVSELIKVTLDDLSSIHGPIYSLLSLTVSLIYLLKWRAVYFGIGSAMGDADYGQQAYLFILFATLKGNGRCDYEAVFVVRREGGKPACETLPLLDF